MARNKFSHQKYTEDIHHTLNLILRREISDPKMSLITFTRVELGPEFDYAKVYWDSFDPSIKESVRPGIKKLAHHLRQQLAKALKLRKVPQLILIDDRQFEAEAQLDSLLAQSKDAQDDGLE